MENEQKTDEKVTTSGTAQNPTNGIPNETAGLLQEARQVAERIEKANIEHKSLLDREEQIRAKELLSGRSSAGYTAPVISEEEKNRILLNELLKGTGIKV